MRIILMFPCYDQWVAGGYFNMVEVGKESRRGCLSQVKPFILSFNHYQK